MPKPEHPETHAEYPQTTVLDKGFVRLVDVLGDDARVVQAARVSYGDGTKTQREDAALIDYLMRNRHTSPFEMVVFTFHIKLPLFVARQWLRHRTASLNEISGRYSVMREEFYHPEPAQVCRQARDNKQGRGQALDDAEDAKQIAAAIAAGQQRAYADYQSWLEAEVARELARINLPLSLYTEMYWSMDLHNLFHFLKLRLDHHAQYEIRMYAEAIAGIIQPIVPLCFQAWDNHIRRGQHFAADELELLRQAIDPETLAQVLAASELRPSRQRELRAKLEPSS